MGKLEDMFKSFEEVFFSAEQFPKTIEEYKAANKRVKEKGVIELGKVMEGASEDELNKLLEKKGYVKNKA